MKSDIGKQRDIQIDRKIPTDRQTDSLTDRKTRPDTRPKPVADVWAGAIMRVFILNVIVFNSSVTTRA